jgi:CubicO group peptidase (beta-lactamase class C family)
VTAAHVAAPEGNGYGYLWWVRRARPSGFFAAGSGGQVIEVFPARSLVIVTTGVGVDPRRPTELVLHALVG